MGSAEAGIGRPPGRYFIGVGVGEYDDPTLTLESAVSDVRSVGTWFAERAGISHVRALEELSDSPRWNEIVTAISGFLAELTADDVVVIWFACHGELEGAQTYLFGRDSPTHALAGRAIPAHTVGQIIGQWLPHNVLVVVDACVAGDVADDIESGIKSTVKSSRTRDPHRSYLHAVVASAYGRNPAHDGRFAEAFLRVVSLEKWTGAADQWITIEQLMRGLKAELHDISPTQVADRTVWGPGAEELIPNPNFKKRNLVGLIADDEFAAHFDPSARGVSVGEAGSFFTGRTAELTEICRWLATPDESSLKVITGSPGTGKSALLARALLLSDANYRPDDATLETLPHGTVPPVDAFTGVVWCHNKTATAVVRELAVILGGVANDADGLLQIAAGRDGTIAIDALDETADDGARLLAELVLAPLARSPGIRLLVGTRRDPVHGAGDATGLVSHLGTRPGEVIDLDLSEQMGADMRAYVRARLMAAERPDASELAERIAEAARPSFLVAAIAARTAIASPHVAPSEYRLPTDVGEALAGYIDRLDEPARARALLRPLAWAGGVGLPWGDLWPLLATAIATADDADAPQTTFTDADVSDLLEGAGDLIVETSAAGQPRYRLFHEALAEHLRADSESGTRVHRVISAAMRLTIMDRPWAEVDSYIVTQLPQHLIAAGQIDDAVAIMTDPLWDRARREHGGDPLAAAIDAGRAIDLMLDADPNDLRTCALCHCHSRANTTAPPLVIDVIANSGQFVRAQVMANNLTFGSDRMVAFSLLAESFESAGRHDDAAAAVAEVEAAISSLPAEHVPMGWYWVARAASAAGVEETVARAASQSFAAARELGGDGWDIPNGLFWSASAARLAGDALFLQRVRDELVNLEPVYTFRNQMLQAAAVAGHRTFLGAQFDDFVAGGRYPNSGLRAGNLALALVDSGMTDQADTVFELVTDSNVGNDDSRKRWSWALALAGRMTQAIQALDTLHEPVELSKGIERLVEIAARDNDRLALEQLAERAEGLLTASDSRVRARLVRCLWLAGKHDQALGLTEQEIAVSHASSWLIDPRDSSAVSLRPPTKARGKRSRREMVESAMPVSDERNMLEVTAAMRSGDHDAAIDRYSEIIVPLFRARAGAAIAEHLPDAIAASQFWLRALAAARLAGRGAVDELIDVGRHVFERAGRRAEFDECIRSQHERDAEWDFESFAEQYTSLRRTVPPGDARTSRMQSLMLVPRRLATERGWSRDEIQAAWGSDHDGKRLFVIGLMSGDPDLADPNILVEAIRESRSAFEQHEALRAAERSKLRGEAAERVLAAVRAELDREPRPDGSTSTLKADSTRFTIASRIAQHGIT